MAEHDVGDDDQVVDRCPEHGAECVRERGRGAAVVYHYRCGCAVVAGGSRAGGNGWARWYADPVVAHGRAAMATRMAR